MFKNISLIVVLCFLIMACDGSDKPKEPDNLIPKEKMSEVLYDLYLINAAKGVNRKLLEENNVVPETYVLTKHNIDSTQFSDSNSYYAFNTDVYKAIVDKVKARLEKEKEEYEALQKEEGQAAKRKRDSLNKDPNYKKALKKKDSIKAALGKGVSN